MRHIGELLQYSLDAQSKLVALLAEESHLGTRGGQLMPKPFDLGLELLDSGIWSRGTFARFCQLHARALQQDF